MSNIDYYVSNCYADMNMIDFLLEQVPDYQNVVVPRHVKFISSYVTYKKNLKMVGMTLGFSEIDVRRIFWRIQRKLLLEFIDRAGKGRIKVKVLPLNFDEFLLWQLHQFREDANGVYIYVKSRLLQDFNINGVSKVRKQQIENVLNELSTYDNLDEILPKNIYPIALDLLNGVSFTDVVEKYKRSDKYLVINIIGSKSPRSKSERGWLAYVRDYEANQAKIINFRLR